MAVRDAEISDLKIRVDELQANVEREKRAKEELQGNYQHRLRERQQEMEQYRMYYSLCTYHISLIFGIMYLFESNKHSNGIELCYFVYN